MIWDATLLWDELDLLALRLRELDDLVDRFLVVQSEETFAGVTKPLALDVTAPRWAPWAGRLMTITAPRLDPSATRWAREHWARQQLVPALADAADDDLVVYSDLDELPDKAVVRRLAPLVTDAAWVGLRPKLYHYYLNLRTPQAWSAIALARVSTVRRIGPVTLRDLRRTPPISVKRGEGGWHFSWLGGPAAIARKIGAWPHDEFDTPHYRREAYIAQRIAARRDLFDKHPGTYWPVPLTDLPREVQLHPDRYAAWLLPEAA